MLEFRGRPSLLMPSLPLASAARSGFRSLDRIFDGFETLVGEVVQRDIGGHGVSFQRGELLSETPPCLHTGGALSRSPSAAQGSTALWERRPMALYFRLFGVIALGMDWRDLLEPDS